MFSSRNKKNIDTLWLKKKQLNSYDTPKYGYFGENIILIFETLHYEHVLGFHQNYLFSWDNSYEIAQHLFSCRDRHLNYFVSLKNSGHHTEKNKTSTHTNHGNLQNATQK